MFSDLHELIVLYNKHPTFSTLSEKIIKSNMFKKLIYYM